MPPLRTEAATKRLLIKSIQDVRLPLENHYDMVHVLVGYRGEDIWRPLTDVLKLNYHGTVWRAARRTPRVILSCQRLLSTPDLPVHFRLQLLLFVDAKTPHLLQEENMALRRRNLELENASVAVHCDKKRLLVQLTIMLAEVEEARRSKNKR